MSSCPQRCMAIFLFGILGLFMNEGHAYAQLHTGQTNEENDHLFTPNTTANPTENASEPIHVLSANYIFVEHKLSFIDAQSYCLSEFGSSLASLHNADDGAEVEQLCDENSGNEWRDPWIFCFIGLHDMIAQRGSSLDGWIWQDGTDYDYMNWAPNEPNNFGTGGEDCVVYLGSIWESGWNDYPCHVEQHFICNRYPKQSSNATQIAQIVTPSHSPSKHPTNMPTTSPSQSPTNPTMDPTIAPTQSPTNFPTDSPSYSPTHAPSTSPTLSPTAAPSTVAQLLKKYVDDETYSDEVNIALYATLFGISSFCILTAMIAHKFDLFGRFSKYFFRVDNVSYLSVILYFVQMTDMSSDIYVVYQLYSYHFEMEYGNIAVQDNVDESTKHMVHVLYVFALTFTVIPYLLNFFSSIRIISKIVTDTSINEYTKAYFKRFYTILCLLTLLSGGSFYALKVINSNFLNLKMFQAGMSRRMVRRYASHKIVLTTLLENIPQLMIQTIFLVELQAISGTVLIALVSSVFNILLSVMSASIANSTHKDEVEIPIKISISWKKENEVGDVKDPFLMTGQRDKVSQTLCDRMKCDAVEIEILSSQKKEHSATVYGVIKFEQNDEAGGYQTNKTKISNLFNTGNCLEKAVFSSFGYDKAPFKEAFSFTVTHTVGTGQEFTLSEEAMGYLPRILSYVDWQKFNKNEQGIDQQVIVDLKAHLQSFKRHRLRGNELNDNMAEKDRSDNEEQKEEDISDSEDEQRAMIKKK